MIPPHLGKDASVTWRPIEERILTVLCDGLPHERDELLVCLNDPLSETSTLSVHLSNIRRKLHADFLIINQEAPSSTVRLNGKGRHPGLYRLISISASFYRPDLRACLPSSKNP